MNTRSKPFTKELLNTDDQSDHSASIPFSPCSRIAASLSSEKADISFFNHMSKVKLAKGIYDEDQFSNIKMILLQALNGYNIKDKEGEEVDVLDIASDRGYL